MLRSVLPVGIGLLVAATVACGRSEPDGSTTPVDAIDRIARASPDPSASSARHPLHTFAGARARLVWVQDRGDGTDVFARGDRLVLMGLDTDDGRGERPLVARIANYAKPLITRRGDRVVFSDRRTRKVFVSDWAGSSVRELVEGFALATWLDPMTRIEWVYYGLYEGQQEPDSYRAVWRVQIDRPAVRERVWDRTPVGEDNFQLSADGQRAAAMFPWPHCGLADLSAGRWRKLSDGCWTSLAPDRSLRFWYLDGSHRHLILMDPQTGNRRRIRINDAPGMNGAEVYHPRWSNHPRFFVVTGPYTLGDDTNRVKGGGHGVEVLVGRFAPQFDRVEAWIRVTSNRHADFLPDLWVAPGSELALAAAPPVSTESGEAPRPDASTRSGSARLVVEARLVEAAAVPTPAAIAPYRRALVAHRYRVLRVLEGEYAQPELMVAHWAIVDGRRVPAGQRVVGGIYRMTVEPYEAHPELESERLILQGDAVHLPLFYEVDRRAMPAGR